MADERAPGLTRRSWLAAAATLPAAAAAAPAVAGAVGSATALPATDQFPDIQGVYLDAGSVHPFSVGARESVRLYLESRAMNGGPEGYDFAPLRQSVLERFAGLINATPAEVAYVQSTSAGEQLAVSALGIPEVGGRIVTDALHFFGSFHLYAELERAGMEVVILPMRENRILMSDMEAAVNDRTRLVALSAVSTINGFQHDLKAVCDLAHAHGAHVYVDAVHAIGAVPFDVRATGVDLVASSSYKWLMGDMGLGFLYARADLIPRLRRPQAGYQQLAAFSSHAYPHDPPGPRMFETRARDDASGLFAMGTFTNTGLAHLDWSLDYIQSLGVETIQAWRQPAIERARAELPRLGFEPMTPEDSTSPLVAFAYKDARQAFGDRLQRAGVRVTLGAHRLRVSASVFNTPADVDRLVEALA
ncbi:aminotransferase class V-fold PLP-dependent enzyme [Brevundimonas sp.]|uniref:aminotransferase class V-fold PLP-dependent enzyme n=1 Tax=Brevundimonas sp. TaxID=1871086 RepID=UPI0025BCC781|nr:aminotransferase class V-fold PLP-dependent enzyme [Brevundimonas sp.]